MVGAYNAYYPTSFTIHMDGVEKLHGVDVKWQLYSSLYYYYTTDVIFR